LVAIWKFFEEERDSERLTAERIAKPLKRHTPKSIGAQPRLLRGRLPIGQLVDTLRQLNPNLFGSWAELREAKMLEERL
jgi:hypothetical protein